MLPCRKNDDVAFGYLALGSQIPSRVDEIRAPEHADGIPIAIVPEADEMGVGAFGGTCREPDRSVLCRVPCRDRPLVYACNAHPAPHLIDVWRWNIIIFRQRRAANSVQSAGLQNRCTTAVLTRLRRTPNSAMQMRQAIIVVAERLAIHARARHNRAARPPTARPVGGRDEHSSN